MSSMRNAVQRRNHRERAQPVERQKWGLLEKHKDYSLRAADHNLKKRKLNALRQKASERNEDEFYFGMVHSSTAGGVKQAKRGQENSGGGGRSLGQDVVKLMKTQDEGYLRTVLQSTKSQRERVEKEMIAADVGVNVVSPPEENRRVVFGDDDESRTTRPVAAVSEDDEPESDGNSDHAEEEGIEGLSKEELRARRRKRHALNAKRRHLETLQDREEQLAAALREVEGQRARMSGTVGGVNKNGVKFKVRQRKK